MDAISLLAAVLAMSLLGALLGAAAGLVPGLHINNVAYMVGASSATLAAFSLAALSFLGVAEAAAPLLVASLVIAALIAHSFSSILPSVFLGAPDPGRALSVLPAHRLLLAGRGYDAVRASVIGCVGGLAASLAALPLFRIIMGDPVDAYDKLRPHMSLILVLIVALLIVSEPRISPGRKDRCILVLSRLRPAAAALGSGMHCGDEASGTVFIRPFMAPRFAGRTVSVSGMVSDVRLIDGRSSFTLEEGGRLEMVVPDGLRHEPVKAGDIVLAEGRVALEVGWRPGARRKALALAVFLASGILGLLVLESGRMGSCNWFPLGAPPVPDAVMMFPLFCGLFGLPTLLLGLWERPANPPQELRARPMGLGKSLGPVMSGTVAGGLMGWYPGMTSAHGSVIAKLLSGDGSDPETGEDGWLSSAREFLVSMSAVAMANVFFNIVALFVIMRARSGALHIAQDILGEGLDSWSPLGAVPPSFALLAFSAAVAAAVACPMTLFVGMRLARLYERVPYRRLLGGVVLFLMGLLFVFSGIAGLAVTGVALCLGLVPPLAGVRRVHLMGAILVPVIAYYSASLPGVMSFLGF